MVAIASSFLRPSFAPWRKASSVTCEGDRYHKLRSCGDSPLPCWPSLAPSAPISWATRLALLAMPPSFAPTCGRPMAQSSGKVGTQDLKETFDHVEFRDDHGAFSYTVSPDYRFEFTQQGARQPIAGRRALSYFIGSGAAARTFLIDDGGFLFESPVTYYRSSASWKASPGFESLDYPNLTRPIVPGCLQCHASGIQANAGTLNGYATPPFLENGVSCERCHGAGSDHIAKGAKMLNPAKLAPAARDSICAQCHLSGEVRVPKARERREPGSDARRASGRRSHSVRTRRFALRPESDQPRGKPRAERLQARKRRQTVVRHLPRSTHSARTRREGGLFSGQMPLLPPDSGLPRD